MGAATDLVRSKPELVAENALLRQQLIILTRSTKRPRLTRADRALLVLLASRMRAWRQALLIVQPTTLLRGHRAGFRLLWRWRSTPRSRQPRVAPDVVALIQRMARENLLWGAVRTSSPRGWRTSTSTVSPGTREPARGLAADYARPPSSRCWARWWRRSGTSEGAKPSGSSLRTGATSRRRRRTDGPATSSRSRS